MKIELSKESHVTRIGENIGTPGVWYWVRAWDNENEKIVNECFKEFTEAAKFYAGLIKHHSQFNTYASVIEVIKAAQTEHL